MAEFTLNHYNKFDYDGLIFHDMKDTILEHSCLTDEQLCNYIQDNLGYAWHIRDSQTLMAVASSSSTITSSYFTCSVAKTHS